MNFIHKRFFSSAVAIFVYIITIGALYGSGVVPITALNPNYLFLFPIGVIIAIVAMSSGISGANFWVPVNVIVLQLEPRISFWLALLTMLFGFGSGVVKHYSQNTMNIKLVARYVMFSVPGAIIGAMFLPFVKTPVLLIAFGSFVALYGMRLLLSKNSLLKNNEKITYVIAFFGGMLKGMVATGIGELLLPRLIDKDGVSHPEAVGTVVGIVFLTNIVAVLTILANIEFDDSLIDNWQQLFSIMVFVAPAVIIGGQIGPKIPEMISKEHLVKYVGGLLIGISYFMFIRGFALL